MSGICYHRGSEKGLWYEIRCIEQDIASKKKRNVDCRFEKELLKSYKKFTEEDYRDGIRQS